MKTDVRKLRTTRAKLTEALELVDALSADLEKDPDAFVGAPPDWLAKATRQLREAEDGDNDPLWTAWAQYWGPILLEDLRQLYRVPA